MDVDDSKERNVRPTVRIRQWLTLDQLFDYFGQNNWIVWAMVRDVPSSEIGGQLMFLVQVATF